MLSYIPTEQSPFQGNNLSGVLKGLSGQPWKTSNMLTSQPPSNNMFSQLNSAIMDGPPKQNVINPFLTPGSQPASNDPNSPLSSVSVGALNSFAPASTWTYKPDQSIYGDISPMSVTP